MNGHKFSKGRKYDKEMERAFDLPQYQEVTGWVETVYT